jgi:tetratricopeptide (TPR) repeat protein
MPLPFDPTTSNLPDPGDRSNADNLASKYCDSGRTWLAANEYTQARSAYRSAIECNPKIAIAYSGLAHAEYHLRDYRAALAAINHSIEFDNTRIDFYHQRALIAKALKDYELVLADCKLILDRAPQHQAARGLQAVALVKTKDYQVALADFDRHLELNPQDPHGYCYRGICYDRLKQYPRALIDLDRAIDLKPQEAIFHHARGRTHQQLGNLPGALADYNLVIQLKPTRASAYDDRAEIHRLRGDYPQALSDCTQAIVLNPQLISAYFRRGITYAELGDVASALADFDRIISLDPDHLNTYIQRSWMYFRQGDYSRSIEDCKAIQRFDKSCFHAAYLLGVIYGLSGLNAQAIVDFASAIELAPNNPVARYQRGIIYYELNHLNAAMDDFTQARLLQERSGELLTEPDETELYAEGVALYYTGQLYSARLKLNLAMLAAKRLNNHDFHERISAFMDKYC